MLIVCISEETLWDYSRVAFPALCHGLARRESFPPGTFPWALQSLAAVLIIFSLGWQNTNQLSHASASCRHNAAEREFGLSVDTKRRRLVLKPHLPWFPVDLLHTTQIYHLYSLA